MARGVFAPGHPGELTQVVDFALVDAVLEETGTRERRLRLLPSRGWRRGCGVLPGRGVGGLRAGWCGLRPGGVGGCRGPCFRGGRCRARGSRPGSGPGWRRNCGAARRRTVSRTTSGGP
ncbi:transposase domain-containing protein [Streptomyces sp. NPDC057910]|uniref:transposase domain-containing protein n=1 Tax=Streptomyces sp. NPDC057910 TaxID=3346278 RepID=UPI0036EF3B86